MVKSSDYDSKKMFEYASAFNGYGNLRPFHFNYGRNTTIPNCGDVGYFYTYPLLSWYDSCIARKDVIMVVYPADLWLISFIVPTRMTLLK